MNEMNLKLDKQLDLPLYLQLYQQIKQEIIAGRIPLGEKLPSKRQLSKWLAISLNTVESAYAQLQAEGYIQSNPRTRSQVSFDIQQTIQNIPILTPETESNATKHYQFDFNPNYIDTDFFPINLWKKQLRQLNNQQLQQLLCHGEKQGENILREQIRKYLYSARGVQCKTEQIIIVAGIEIAMMQLCWLFNQLEDNKPFTYAMEQYGYTAVERLLTINQKHIVKLPLLTTSQKIDLNLLEQYAVNILYATPSHQYPYASVLSINERYQLLEWANKQSDRYIIEDDYDSEFRYQGRPIPALQGLDHQGKVIYLGSFSKVLMPSLRLSFIVLPQQLLRHYQQICGQFNCSVPRINQHIVANFMQSGRFERHIQRMRTHYRKKMELLCHLLQAYSQDVRYYGAQSGFYLLIELYKETRTLEELEKLAEQASIKVYPIQNLQQKRLFSLGFGNLHLTELKYAIPKLMQIWHYTPIFC
ncbi:PLP-dependent aminotransferase family protein [Gallibacterium melopsittaci]|uniref:PLP-dependent aminotransferase family protein n=1 Tax=Gallibacterium melopsittaci TaxID=516063 RepID=A0ABV6HY85_9PAST